MDNQPSTTPNFDAWQLLNRETTSPQSYIDWCFYYMIAAALQRRVWMGNENHRPLYSNIYVTLVGPPACGKGMAINPMSKILRYHKLQKPGHNSNRDEVSKEMLHNETEITQLLAADPELAKKFDNVRKAAKEEHLTIPMGANATTFESLAETIAGSVRYINYKRYDKALAKEITDTYSHCSLAFVLTELSSLFKRQSENIVNLITDMYDCVPYTYKTKTKGTDHIAKGCLNFLAGTTFSYMEEVFSDRIINEGYASRSFFVVESKARFFRWDVDQLDKEQEQAEKDLIQYVKKLTTIYGEVHFSKEANDFLRQWWEVDMQAGVRANLDPKLEPYYGRKNIHVKKMAMVLHFSEDKFPAGSIYPSMEITLATTIRAMKVLAAIEQRMHLALNFSSGNPLYKPTKKLLQILLGKPQGMTAKDLMFEMFEHCNVSTDFQPIIEYLTGVEKIEGIENPDPSRKHKGLIYKIKTHELNADP